MKASRVSNAQKAFILKRGAGMPEADICRKAGISQIIWIEPSRAILDEVSRKSAIPYSVSVW